MKSLQVIQQSHTRAGDVLPAEAHALGVDFDNDDVLVAAHNTLYRYSHDCRDVSHAGLERDMTWRRPRTLAA
jgi:hypothetical protein